MICLKFIEYICIKSQAKYKLLEKDNTIMKTSIYVEQTWVSTKFFSQAKNEIVREQWENLLVTLSLSEGMTCMNALNNEETSLLYKLLVSVACGIIIQFGVIIHFT